MDKIIAKMSKCDKVNDIRELWDLIGKYHSDNTLTAHNLIAGIPVDENKVLFYQLINGIGCHIVSYPPKKTKHVKRAIITGIAILDVKNDETGGDPTILADGVGLESVDIKLVSEWLCRRMSFCLIIIGKYIEDIVKNDINDTINDID